MERLKYADFNLRIGREGEHYTARVLDSPAGEASTTFELPFTEDRLELLVMRLGRTRSGARSGGASSEIGAAREFGGKLFEAVFSNEVYTCFRRSLDRAYGQDGTGLRLKLRLQDVPELADLPWEFLFDASFNRFIARSNQTPIVRYIEMSQTIHPLKVELPLQILVMISSPADYVQLDVQREKSLLHDSLEPLVRRGEVEVDWLDNATLTTLQRHLRQHPVHVFHFIGHGEFDNPTGQGALVLEDDAGKGWSAEAERIGTILHDHRPLRLAVLNSCEGARNSKSDPFTGVATGLISLSYPSRASP